MIEYIAMGAAGLVMYLFITGRMYALLRCTCMKCGNRGGFVMEQRKQWSSYDHLQCPKCGSREMISHNGNCSLKKNKGNAGFQASLWPFWILPVLVLKLGTTNGYKSIERGLNENVRSS